MMRPENGPRREMLGFVNAVRNVLGSLLHEHGFIETGCDVYTVRYQGPHGLLVVMHDAKSYELEISLTSPEVGDDNRPFGIVDFIRLADRDIADEYRSFAATSPDAVRRGVERLADDLSTYAELALKPDRSFLRRVEEARQQATVEFGKNLNRVRNKEAGDQAMRDQDWVRIIDLYEPREAELSRLERKRLDMARKRLVNPG